MELSLFALWNFSIHKMYHALSHYLLIQFHNLLTQLLLFPFHITNLVRMKFELFIQDLKVTGMLSQDWPQVFELQVQCSFHFTIITVYYYQLMMILKNTRISKLRSCFKELTIQLRQCFLRWYLWNPDLQVWCLIVCVNLDGSILDVSEKMFLD